MYKSPGLGDIYTEQVKYEPKYLFIAQEEWRKPYITAFYKKYTKTDSKNYRGITIICTIGKMYSKTIKKD